MRSSLFILPFLAILMVAIGVITGISIKELPWISYVFWGAGITSLALWLILDLQGFKSAFQRKGAKYGTSSGITVVLGVLIIVGIGFLSSRVRFNKSIDVTRDQLNTLSDQSLKAINQVTSTGNAIAMQGFFQDEPKKLEFTNLLALYQEQGLEVNLEMIDPREEPAKAMAANITVADTVILKMDGNEARLTNYSEEKFTNGLLSLLNSKTKKILFTSGHGEKDLTGQDNNGYALAKQELESERFVVETVNLLDHTEVPDDTDLLVIAGPVYDFRQNEIAMIDGYLQQGKPLMVLHNAVQSLPNLEALAVRYGLKFDDNLLLLHPEDPRAQFIGENNAIVTDFDKFSPATKDFAQQGSIALIVSNARSLSEVSENPNNMKPSLIARTAETIIAVDNVNSAKDLENITAERIRTGPFAVVGISVGQVGGEEIATNESQDQMKDIPAEQPKKSKELRVAAIGSSDLVSNIGAQRGENVDMFLNVVSYLTQDESFISIRPKDITKSSLDLTSSSSQLLLLFFSYLYPTIFLGGGIVYWMRRRRA